MPKRPADDERGGGRSAKLPPQRRHHLYLVLDDWELGYSIRKVDLPSGCDCDEADGDGVIDRTEHKLQPAVFRLEAPHGCSGQFAAFGTKIMFLGTHNTHWGTVPMYDVRRRALTSAPRPDSGPEPYGSAYLQVDGKFFLLTAATFEMLPPAPPPAPPPLAAARDNIKPDWSWRTLPSPPPYHIIVSHAVHRDGQTVVASMTKHCWKKGQRLTTFSFDMETSQWARHGAWGLPFDGRGYFDPDLDAWVGLSCDPDTRGHLCACDVFSADNKDPPACKLSKERLFCVNPVENHIGATLVYVGDNGGSCRFCLMQGLSIDDRQDST
ncbi:hypothetical protein BS78_04G254100 [Paspalum vaginatum]|nr:hypothetical protein BS78_04G254100 [Paspalum vaginatum]